MRISRTIVPVLLAAVLLGGCGGPAGDRSAMNQKFEDVDYEISRLETVTSQYNDRHFAAATQRYIGLVRQYKDLLGTEEAKRRLNEEADTISGYCLPCAGMLSKEAQKY